MSDGPLDAWSEVTEWSAELACSVTDDHNVISVTDPDKVVGTSRTRWQVVTSGHLDGPVASSWRGDGLTSASWEEETNIDESGQGWIEKARGTASGSGTGTGTIVLSMGIDLTNGPPGVGVYSLNATGLTFEVTTTSWIFSQDPVSNIPSEGYEVSTGTREVFFPDITFQALPHSGLVLEGEKRVPLSGSAIANVTWSLRPLSTAGPCNLTGISPTDVTLFIDEPRKFTAQGTGLADVEWSAPGGSPATGTGPMFTTKWLETGEKTLTATCGGTTKTATVKVLAVAILINNTSSGNDNIVQVKCYHPAQRFSVPCTIGLLGPASGPLTVVLTNPDGRLRFPGPADTTRTLVLPANGAMIAFEITGEHASAAIGDAKIQARLAMGQVVTEENVTVFTFDAALIFLDRGGNYSMIGDNYGVVGTFVVEFTSRATIEPAGLDCTAPQIANLRIGIMQEVSGNLRTTTYDAPTIVWDPHAPSGTIITVGKTNRESRTFSSIVAQPVNDGFTGAFPLYDNDDSALTPPAGCPGASAAISNDAAGVFGIPRTLTEDISSSGGPLARVTWTVRLNTTFAVHFRTFCVVFNTTTNKFCALRQATWTLNVDSSGPPADQHAFVNHDSAASADPAAVLPTANDASIIATDSYFGPFISWTAPSQIPNP